MPKELDQTNIPVSVPTNYLHSNKIDEASMQLEQLSYQIQSLFFLLQKTCLLYDHLEMAPEQVYYNFNTLRGEIDSVCLIGLGLADAVQVCGERLTREAKDLQSKVKEPSSLKKVG